MIREKRNKKMAANVTSKGNTVLLDTFMEVADFLNENPKMFAEITSGLNNFLVFVSVKNRLTVRTSHSFRHWSDSDVGQGEITESSVENLVYDVSGMI